MTTRYTVNIRPCMFRLGSGERANEPQGYEVEFFAAGEFFTSRCYSFSEADERTMMRRLNSWLVWGAL